MSTLSVSRSPYDSSYNPFIRTINPFRVTEKFYTYSSSQQKYGSQGSLNKNFLQTSCNHCVKNAPFLQELQTRSKYLKHQKQNLQKISAVKFKRTQQNPFHKQSVFNGCKIQTKNQYVDFSRQDQNKLRNLIQNNPFKKYQHQIENHYTNPNNGMDIHFHQIDFLSNSRLRTVNKENAYKENNYKVNISRDNRQSQRFSFQSMYRNNSRRNSIQNSPGKKSKFSPTMMDIATYRVTSLVENKGGLLDEISRSRKDLLMESKRQNIQSQRISMYNNSPKKNPPKSPQKQISPLKINAPEFIMIRGNKFFLNKVQMRY